MKNAEGNDSPATCKADLQAKWRRWLERRGVLVKDGTVEMVYNDVDLPYRCPLIDDEIPLEDDFVEELQAAWELLVRDPRIREIVREDSIEREKSMKELMDKLL